MYSIHYNPNIIEEVTDSDTLQRISNILDKEVIEPVPDELKENNNNDFDIKIVEFHDYNIVYFVNEFKEIILVPKGITYEKKNSKRYQVNRNNEFINNCIVILPGYDYIIYHNDILIYEVECEKSFEITNEISREKSRLIFK
jgi:hypothetical protein